MHSLTTPQYPCSGLRVDRLRRINRFPVHGARYGFPAISPTGRPTPGLSHPEQPKRNRVAARGWRRQQVPFAQSLDPHWAQNGAPGTSPAPQRGHPPEAVGPGNVEAHIGYPIGCIPYGEPYHG